MIDAIFAKGTPLAEAAIDVNDVDRHRLRKLGVKSFIITLALPPASAEGGGGAAMRKLAHLIYEGGKTGNPFDENFATSGLAIQDGI